LTEVGVAKANPLMVMRGPVATAGADDDALEEAGDEADAAEEPAEALAP
jgi:hypothetical protein